MREIKFRAWDKQAKRMIQSHCHVGKDGRMIVGWEPQEVDYELMQFTGLKDKNNNPIFEGDVVDIEYMSDGFKVRGNVTIVFRNGAFRAKTNRDYLFDLAEYDNEVIYGEPEVVGNIYENPDLLETDKE